MIVGACVYVISVAVGTTVVIARREETQEGQRSMRVLNQLMTDCDLPGKLRKKARVFHNAAKDIRNHMARQQEVLKALSPGIYEEISGHIFSDAIHTCYPL